jgi:hypothetical protein
MSVASSMVVPDWHELTSPAFLNSTLKTGAATAVSHCRREHPDNPVEGVSISISAANRRTGGQLIYANGGGVDGPWKIDRRSLDALMAEMAAGNQQRLCHVITDTRSKQRDITDLISGEKNPLKQQQFAALRAPILRQAQDDIKFGEFFDFIGRVTELEPVGAGNSYKLAVALDCPGEYSPVAIISSTFTSSPGNDDQTDVEPFRAVLSPMAKGDAVRVSGTNVTIGYGVTARLDCGADQQARCDKPLEFSARITKLEKDARSSR